MFSIKFYLEKLIKTVVVIFMIVLITSVALAYDDQISHPRITVKAVENSDLENYLINYLGFKQGLDELFQYNNTTNRVVELIKIGSTYEDDPMCRASNHFHNPLLIWDQSYLSDEPLWLNIVCLNWTPRYSNITWATGYLAPPPGGSKVAFPNPSLESPVNWDVAREYYYNALTSNLNNREYYFANTFEALGRVIHLLEDVSVPAHVRNDFTSHLAFNGISSLNPTKWVIQPFEYYVKSNPGLIITAEPVPPAFSNMKLTDFWDTDQYDGNNPSTSVSRIIRIHKCKLF